MADHSVAVTTTMGQPVFLLQSKKIASADDVRVRESIYRSRNLQICTVNLCVYNY